MEESAAGSSKGSKNLLKPNIPIKSPYSFLTTNSRKTRKSMLGKRIKMKTPAKTINFKTISGPSHPFPEYENSRFFETGLSEIEPWSVFKTDNRNKMEDKINTAKTVLDCRYDFNQTPRDLHKSLFYTNDDKLRMASTEHWVKKMQSTPPSPPKSAIRLKKKLSTPKTPVTCKKENIPPVVEPVARKLYPSPINGSDITFGVNALNISDEKQDSFVANESMLEAISKEPDVIPNFKQRFLECRELYEVIKVKELELNNLKIQYHDCHTKMLEAFDLTEENSTKNNTELVENASKNVRFNFSSFTNTTSKTFLQTPSALLNKPAKTQFYTPRSLNTTLQRQIKNMEKSD